MKSLVALLLIVLTCAPVQASWLKTEDVGKEMPSTFFSTEEQCAREGFTCVDIGNEQPSLMSLDTTGEKPVAKLDQTKVDARAAKDAEKAERELKIGAIKGDLKTCMTTLSQASPTAAERINCQLLLHKYQLANELPLGEL